MPIKKSFLDHYGVFNLFLLFKTHFHLIWISEKNPKKCYEKKNNFVYIHDFYWEMELIETFLEKLIFNY